MFSYFQQYSSYIGVPKENFRTFIMSLINLISYGCIIKFSMNRSQTCIISSRGLALIAQVTVIAVIYDHSHTGPPLKSWFWGDVLGLVDLSNLQNSL